MIDVDWNNPFSQWIVAVADAVLRRRWWGDTVNRSDLLIEWLARPDHSCPAAIAPLDALSRALADTASLSSPEQSVADFLSEIGLSPLGDTELKLVLAAYVVRSDQTDGQIRESAEIMRTMRPEDQEILRGLYVHLEYYADLLSDDEEDRQAVESVRQVFVTHRAEVDRLTDEILLPGLRASPWLLPSLREARFCQGCDL